MSRKLILAVGTLALCACGANDTPSAPVTDYKTYTLAQAADSVPVRYGETVRVNGALLTFASLISDTRCAAQAQCVAPGDAEVLIAADPVCYPQCLMPSLPLSLHMYSAPRFGDYYGMRVTLSWLLPLPETPGAKPDPTRYVAWLKVENTPQ